MGRPLDPSHSHKIDLREAAEQARLHRSASAERATALRKAGQPAPERQAGAFNADAVRELLAQPGCVGLRYYHARTAKGEETLLLVGVNESGDDMTSGVLLNSPVICPPFCPDPNDLNT